jgi:uncharacterized iron-regulated membrane protein
MLAHGGVGGAIVEVSALVALVGLAVGVWLRERKTQGRE